MRDLPIGEESNQWQIAEFLLDEAKFFRVRAKGVAAAPQAREIQCSPGLGLGCPALDLLEHSDQVVPSGRTISPTEHDLTAFLRQITDRDELVFCINTDNVTHQVVAGIRAYDGQRREYVPCRSSQVSCLRLSNILLEDL